MKKAGIFIISNAIIWGAVLIGCALALRGTDGYPKIQSILYGGMMVSMVLSWGSVAMFKKLNKPVK